MRDQSADLRQPEAGLLGELLQRRSADELGDDVGRLAVAGEVEDLEDVGIVKLGHRPGLAREAAAAVGTGGQVWVEDLDGHLAIELAIPGPVDLRHAAAPHQLSELVAIARPGKTTRDGFHIESLATVARERQTNACLLEVPPRA